MENFIKSLNIFIENEDLSISKHLLAKLYTEIQQNSISLKNLLEIIDPYLNSEKERTKLRAVKILVKCIHKLKELNWNLKNEDLFKIYCLFEIIAIKDPIANYAGYKGILRILEKLQIDSSENSQKIYLKILDLLGKINISMYDEKNRRLFLRIFIALFHTFSQQIISNPENYTLFWLKCCKNENSHINCKLIFDHCRLLLKSLPPSDIKKYCPQFFNILSMYFPVRISKAVLQKGDLQKNITDALINCFCSTPYLVDKIIPFFIEKLKSISVDVILDTLYALICVLKVYPNEKYNAYLNEIYGVLLELLHNNVNPDVLTMTIEVFCQIWALNLENENTIKIIQQIIMEIKGTDESPSSLLIKHAVDLQENPILCNEIFASVLFKLFEIFINMSEGMQKSMLLRSISKSCFMCLQSPNFNPEYIMRYNKQIEKFIKQILLGPTQYDRYDILIIVYFALFSNFNAKILNETIVINKSVQILVEIMNSRLFEEKRFQEIVINAIKLVDKDFIEKNEILKEQIKNAFNLLENDHKNILIQDVKNTKNIDHADKIQNLLLISNLCKSDEIFIKFSELLIKYLRESQKILIGTKINSQKSVENWIFLLFDSLKNAAESRILNYENDKLFTEFFVKFCKILEPEFIIFNNSKILTVFFQ